MTPRSDESAADRAPAVVNEHASQLFDEARSILGSRFAEARHDPDRGLRVTVIDLDDNDTAAIAALAQRFGIADWVRIERADPSALDSWERLRHDLLRLQYGRPGLLQQFPAPEPGYRRPPVEISLAATAESEAAAADLHARYGTFVSLRVGALPYPPETDEKRSPRPQLKLEPILADPAEMQIRLDGPLSIRRGETATHGLLLTNLTDHEIEIFTNGHLTASIVDPKTSAIIGGSTGAEILPLVIFAAVPAKTVRIPLIVGTTSFEPDLGYSVPPGDWQLTAPLNLTGRRHLITPPLDLTITE